MDAQPVYEFGKHGGGTPSVLRRRNVYFIWFREDAKRVQEISLITSRDMREWKYYPRVFQVSDGWNSIVLAGADIVERGDQLYMYYRGSAFENQMRSDIGLAVSKDGKAWRRFSRDPVFKRSNGAWDSELVADPHIVSAGKYGSYWMFYSGHDNADLEESDSVDTVGLGKKIGLAVSADGIHWQRCFDEPLVEYGLKADNPFARLDGVILHLWFRATDNPSGKGGKIVYQRYEFEPRSGH